MLKIIVLNGISFWQKRALRTMGYITRINGITIGYLTVQIFYINSLLPIFLREI